MVGVMASKVEGNRASSDVGQWAMQKICYIERESKTNADES